MDATFRRTAPCLPHSRPNLVVCSKDTVTCLFSMHMANATEMPSSLSRSRKRHQSLFMSTRVHMVSKLEVVHDSSHNATSVRGDARSSAVRQATARRVESTHHTGALVGLRALSVCNCHISAKSSNYSRLLTTSHHHQESRSPFICSSIACTNNFIFFHVILGVYGARHLTGVQRPRPFGNRREPRIPSLSTIRFAGLILGWSMEHSSTRPSRGQFLDMQSGVLVFKHSATTHRAYDEYLRTVFSLQDWTFLPRKVQTLGPRDYYQASGSPHN